MVLARQVYSRYGLLMNTSEQWAVVVAYSYRNHERGDVISRHSTYALACKAHGRHAYSSHLAVKEI